MSLLSRYNIKYNIDSIDEKLINKYIGQITSIYYMVNDKYNGYMTDKKDTVILSGSAAILYYLYSLNYSDLIINNIIQTPSDINLLMVYYTKTKPVIDELYIEDFKQKKADDKVSSATFINKWTRDAIREFDLTYVPFAETHWNEINGINVLDLTELKSFYSLIISEKYKRTNTNMDDIFIKLDIIQKIIQRLKLNPRPDIIKPGVRFSIKLLSDNFVPEIIDFDSDIIPIKLISR
jgi:hypothetical protein